LNIYLWIPAQNNSEQETQDEATKEQTQQKMDDWKVFDKYRSHKAQSIDTFIVKSVD